MKIYHLLVTLNKVNAGVINAACATAALLERKNIASIVVSPESENEVEVSSWRITPKDLPYALQETNHSIIIAHGCWGWPTTTGAALSRKYKIPYIHLPHGMLEPWSMQQNRLMKWAYFHLKEKRMISKADVVQAVGYPEYQNLKKRFNDVIHLPNGVETGDFNYSKAEDTIHFTFLSRFHHKKGIIPMIKAWQASSLQNNSKFQLNLAGPDDGELQNIKAELKSENIKLLGPVYGLDKKQLFEKTNFFILPSFSEGFPVSVLEAMERGCIPLISEGCNFPEVFINNLGLKLSPELDSIKLALENAAKFNLEQLKKMSFENHLFIANYYSLEKIAVKQHELYKSLFLKRGLRINESDG